MFAYTVCMYENYPKTTT